jgi:alpha-tubulin suppressor-like RCC1 family protein
LNSSGQLGDGTTTQRLYPVTVKLPNGVALSGITRIACGATHSLALKSDGTVWAWGANASGQIGDGTTTARSFATQVKATSSTFLTAIVSIAGGTAHSAAVKYPETTTWCWGLNGSGQLGNGGTKSSSFPVRSVSTSEEIYPGEVACGANHTFGHDGMMWAWGSNANGQLGDNTTTTRKNAVRVIKTASPLQTLYVASIPYRAAAGASHSIALEQGVFTWGLNTSGQLGIGSTTQKTLPQQVLPDAFGVAAGANLWRRQLRHAICTKIWMAIRSRAHPVALPAI